MVVEMVCVSENWVKVNNRAVRYIVKGDGKPMVMVHGYNFSADDWINCCGDGLRGFRIYAVDWEVRVFESFRRLLPMGYT